ncbi:TetR/AcrR family transcriptional regulator [Nocardia otitidiscaviarum]|uniref:TetR/AcrR family transcriptional regulator n=1 Tax=Nocardia otitidiscaviarum TaxID=1823 RepID=UPI0018946B0C|nr:TetR/AcrR family transcriptional regulator [Nocardia otitidiscaviarum]MBF6179205.1 TetR/AcrR family transcriptional regulator [Nocardia otitidiscaviarum]
MSPRNSFAEAARTRTRIVLTAVDEASSVGLEGLTIGSLADRLAMSKAGVVGPFGSRENLQRAALEQAGQIFRATVLAPLEQLPPGAARLARLIDAWIDYLAECPFPGGCFVTAASTELDGRPGALRDRLRTIVADWRTYLTAEITAAQQETSTSPCPPDEIATVLIGISMSVNQEIQLLDDASAAQRGRAAMRQAAGLPAES